jgi:hypothetical protein
MSSSRRATLQREMSQANDEVSRPVMRAYSVLPCLKLATVFGLRRSLSARELYEIRVVIRVGGLDEGCNVFSSA